MKITPGTSTVAKFKTTIVNLLDYRESQTQRRVNAFIMYRLPSHPMPALYNFVILRLRHTRHGVDCLVRCHKRTRLTTTIRIQGSVVWIQNYKNSFNYMNKTQIKYSQTYFDQLKKLTFHTLFTWRIYRITLLPDRMFHVKGILSTYFCNPYLQDGHTAFLHYTSIYKKVMSVV